MNTQLQTPTLVIDMSIVEKNIKTMSRIAKSNNCSLRPHIKTHKVPELAKLQLLAGATGITCAKISEAQVMAEAGIKDIFIAYPIVDDEKLTQAFELAKSIRVIFSVDSFEGARILSDRANMHGFNAEVRMEVDTGLKRTGVTGEDALKLAGYIKGLPRLNLSGIFTYRGLILEGLATDDRKAAGLQEGQMLTSLAEKLHSIGIEVKDISVGSTPTSEYASEVEGVTEIRPGTYIFNDMMQVSVKAATIDDCAAKVIVSVISTPSEEIAVIDGGSKSFSTDAKMDAYPYNLNGYGKIEGHDHLIFDRLWEEHGIIKSSRGKTNLKIGQKLCVIPNHVCTTVNLYDYVFFKNGDGSFRKVKVEARGKSW